MNDEAAHSADADVKGILSELNQADPAGPDRGL